MKTHASLFVASAAILAGANVVAAGWLKVSPGQSFSDYCTPGGAQANSAHVCFKTKPSFFKHILPDSDFRGYLSSDMTGFVLLDGSNEGNIVSDAYKIHVTFATVQPSIGRPKCASIEFSRHDNPDIPFRRDLVCQPGGQVVELPAIPGVPAVADDP